MRLWLPARKARLPIPCFSALYGWAAERPSRCRSASEDLLTEAEGRNMKSLMFVAAIAGMMASLPAAAEEREAIGAPGDGRSEAHTSELQSLMRITYAVVCLK